MKPLGWPVSFPCSHNGMLFAVPLVKLRLLLREIAFVQNFIEYTVSFFYTVKSFYFFNAGILFLETYVLHWKWIPVFVIVLFVPFIKNFKTELHNEILNTEHKNCFKIIFPFKQIFNFKVFVLIIHCTFFPVHKY
jgi:hypothetical protein